MSNDTIEPTEGPEQTEATPADDGLMAAPADAAEDVAKGYAVFNRTLGQYVPGVLDKRPSGRDAAKRVPEGHTAAVVRV